MSIILGIETSCDDTAIAIYDSDVGLLANTLYSQIELHSNYGGVVPELASRDHIQKILPLIKQCLFESNIKLEQIDAISYTAGPGLNGALLVGSSIANSLGYSLGIPVIPIHHLEGHLLSPFLSDNKVALPFVALLVSGGHTQFIAVNAIGSYELLGETLDDAAGEAFDKTAKMLGLPYPGGKYIAQIANKAVTQYNLPRPMLFSKDLNMSFSGLKTAVLSLIKNLEKLSPITEQIKSNIAKSIEEAITDVLVAKSKQALIETGYKNLVICGGVSANLTLRNKMNNIQNIKIFYPPLELCTDNGAMIAIAGFYRLNLAKYNYSFVVKPRWLISQIGEI